MAINGRFGGEKIQCLKCGDELRYCLDDRIRDMWVYCPTCSPEKHKNAVENNFRLKEKKMSDIKLGSKAKDTITGYSGIVIARTEWLHGCDRVTIQSQEMKDGVPVESRCFDILQVELIQEEAVVPSTPAQKKTGGPRPSASRHADPTR